MDAAFSLQRKSLAWILPFSPARPRRGEGRSGYGQPPLLRDDRCLAGSARLTPSEPRYSGSAEGAKVLSGARLAEARAVILKASSVPVKCSGTRPGVVSHSGPPPRPGPRRGRARGCYVAGDSTRRQTW